MTPIYDDDLERATARRAEATPSLERLGGLWALDTLEPTKRVTRVRVHGRGGKAHVRVDLDNGEWIELDRWAPTRRRRR